MSEENQNHTEQKIKFWNMDIDHNNCFIRSRSIRLDVFRKNQKAYKSCQTTNAQLELEMQSMNEALSGYIDGSTMDLKDFQMMLDTYDKLIEKDASKSDSLQAQKDSISVLLAQLSDTKTEVIIKLTS